MKMRTLTRLGAVVGAAALLTGCMKMEYSLELQEDDTIDGSTIIAYDKSVIEEAEDAGVTLDEMMEETEEELPDNTTREPYEDGDYQGYEYFYEGMPLGFTESDGLFIEREGDEFVINGDLDLSNTGIDESDPEYDFDLSDIELSYAITFPGEVTEHNGELDGKTVTWKVNFGENSTLEARGSAIGNGEAPSTEETPEDTDEQGEEAEEEPEAEEDSDSTAAEATDEDDDGFPWLWVLLGGLGLLLIIVIVVIIIVLKKNKGGNDVGPGGPDGQYPPQGGYPQQQGGFQQGAPYQQNPYQQPHPGQPQQPGQPGQPPQPGQEPPTQAFSPPPAPQQGQPGHPQQPGYPQQPGQPGQQPGGQVPPPQPGQGGQNPGGQPPPPPPAPGQ